MDLNDLISDPSNIVLYVDLSHKFCSCYSWIAEILLDNHAWDPNFLKLEADMLSVNENLNGLLELLE